MHTEPPALTRARYRLDPADLPVALTPLAVWGIFLSVMDGNLPLGWIGGMYLTGWLVATNPRLFAQLSCSEQRLAQRAAELPDGEFHALRRQIHRRSLSRLALWAAASFVPGVLLALVVPATLAVLALSVGLVLAGPFIRDDLLRLNVIDAAQMLRNPRTARAHRRHA